MKKIMWYVFAVFTMYAAIFCGGYFCIYRWFWIPLWNIVVLINSHKDVTMLMFLTMLCKWVLALIFLAYSVILFKVGEFIFEEQQRKPEGKE